MSNVSRRFQQRSRTWIGVGCLLFVGVNTGPAAHAAAAPSACAERAQRASIRSLGRMLRCAVKEKRAGVVTSACPAEEVAVRTRILQRPAACTGAAAAALAAMDHCATEVLANISGHDRCAARKLGTVADSLRRYAHGRHGERQRARLCQAFERAGDCSGSCLVVDAVLARCWTAARPQHTLPTASADEQVILFGANGGDAVSRTTIAGQDEETTTAEVVIEPGDTPLYVLLTSYAQVIWRFEGAVSRVSHVVLLGSAAGGVTGIAAERVADLTSTSGDLSESFYVSDSPEARRLRSAVEDALVRPIDAVAGSYSVGILTLPSTTVAEHEVDFYNAPTGFDFGLYLYGSFFHPGGVVDIDPSGVVSSVPAERYEVLPEIFGLAQLVATGALEARGEYFYIARPIARFPAALSGVHSEQFVLGTGVPMPPGSPGASCVVSEETGLPLNDATLCPFLFPAFNCDLPAADAADQIVLFGAYESDAIASTTIVGQDEETDTARVVVASGSTPLYVVLTSLESTIWRFEGATSRIHRLVLVGYGAQAVTGVAPELITDRSGGNECPGYFYDVQGPDGITIRRGVERTLGRPIDVAAGSYSLGTLFLPSAAVEASVESSVVPPGFDAAVYQLGLWFYPGGVVDIDPASVVPRPAEPYEVLPDGFGLAQLVATGALENRGAYFYIARAIPRFPAGLYGAQSVNFVLGRGVPLPAGSPGHSCVIDEETGRPVGANALCDFDFLPPLGG